MGRASVATTLTRIAEFPSHSKVQAGATTGATQRVRLPRNLQEAIDAFVEDPLVHDVFSPQLVSAYADMKQGEWDDYHRQVSAWERDKYLLAF